MVFYENNTAETLAVKDASTLEEGMTKAPCPELSAIELRKAWWCCFYLNMSAMWAYYTLLSAQNVYSSLYPDANINFLGIMFTGIAMTSGQLFTMLMQFDGKGGFDLRVQGAYVAFALLAMMVTVFQQAGTILAAWALTGLINTLSESKLYTLAAIGASNGELTNAVQLGNGSAGVINVIATTTIRICVYAALGAFGGGDGAAQAQTDGDRLSFYLFMGLLIVMSLCAVPVYRYLVNMPGFKRRLAEFRNSDEEAAGWSFGDNLKHLCRVTRSIWGAAFIQFLCFFMSLSVFPAIPCSVALTNSVFSPAWYCSQGIIPAFNGGDWLGRLLCMLPAVQNAFKGSARVNGMGIGRVVFLAIIMFCTLGKGDAAALPWIVLFSMILFSLTGGVVSTLTMMRAPLRVECKDRETAAQIMVLALYAGIASGTILAAVLDKLGLV